MYSFFSFSHPIHFCFPPFGSLIRFVVEHASSTPLKKDVYRFLYLPEKGRMLDVGSPSFDLQADSSTWWKASKRWLFVTPSSASTSTQRSCPSPCCRPNWRRSRRKIRFTPRSACASCCDRASRRSSDHNRAPRLATSSRFATPWRSLTSRRVGTTG